jgi:hypothetical protein
MCLIACHQKKTTDLDDDCQRRCYGEDIAMDFRIRLNNQIMTYMRSDGGGFMSCLQICYRSSPVIGEGERNNFWE